MGSTSNRKTEKIKEKKKTLLKNYASWFEIPVINFEQALRFYNYIYEIEMQTIESGEYTMALFPANGGVGGAVVCGPGSIPSESGSLIYLNAGNDLNNILNRVNEAGGRVIMPKTLINEESGYFAVFIDIEGNKMAFHSKK